MNQNYIDNLVQDFPKLNFQQNVMLAPYTFMKVGGPAKLFVEITDIEDLYNLSAFCFIHAVPFIVLGGVSNSVIPDEGLDKLVILNKTNQVTVIRPVGDATEKMTVVSDSGVITASLANETMKEGLTGLEHFVGVPGTIGGAVVNNSHFTLQELIGNFITQVEVCTETGKREIWLKGNLQFAYDHSIFQELRAVVLRATFELYRGDQVHIQEKMLAAAKKRASSQPIGIPSTGCMFKNPRVSSAQLAVLGSQLEIPESALKTNDGATQIAAGFLIDKAGLKGMTVGGAAVSDKHATYIINTGTATSEDINTLANQVEAGVLEKFGIKLEREVFFVN